MSLSNLVSGFTSRGVTVKTLGDAVVGAKNWVLRQTWASQVLAVYAAASFNFPNLPNFGKSGGTSTLSKAAGERQVYLSTNGNSRISVTLEGLASAAANFQFSAPVDTSEADAAAAEVARLEAAATAARAKAAEAAAKVAAAKANTKSADSLLSNFLSSFSR